ncbi:ABC transporter permease [Amycolatopsis jejuensis]|uniref:ABC transporter permease n=1 Tax=Amycolatopsis jejuensis TaxID=330084 RepID=UPI0006905E3E|nr:ABC transporter permease [Amycolatopsis jejuensis]
MTAGLMGPSRRDVRGAPAAPFGLRDKRAMSPGTRRAIAYLGRIALPVLVLGLWQWAVDREWLNVFFVSRPSDIFEFLRKAVQTGTTWSNLWVTIQETLIGFGLATVLGIGAGLLFTRVPLLHDMVRPYLTAVNSLPRVALAPIFVLWFGLGQVSKVALVVSLCFFIVLSATMGAIGNVDPDLTRLSRVLGFSQAEIFRKVMLPWAIPGIFAGLELALVYAFVGAVAGEMIAATAGIGQQIQFYTQNFNTAAVLGTLAILAIVTTVIAGFMNILRRYLLRYQRQ